jgi:GAF domain-containing protein
MAVREPADGAAADRALDRAVESRYLYQIISTVSSTLDLERVLRAIVDLVTEAIDCHACFLYFVEPDGSVVLRAVSDPYRALVGRLRFARGEGLAGWVAEHGQPVFLAENALADPRVKIVPEAEEEKYQSLVAVPLTATSGEVVGVIALHTEAPREFSVDDSEFLVGAARLVAGAIENARLYQDTRRRLALVEGMADVARAVSAAPTLDELLPTVARAAGRLLGAAACHVLLAEPGGGQLRVGASWPADAPAPRAANANELGIELALAGRRGETDDGARLAALLFGDERAPALVVPLVAADELVGFLALRFARGRALEPDEREIAASVASQTGVAIKKVQLIERLTERGAIKDFFEDLSRGGGDELRERASALGCDLDQPHLVLVAVPRPGPAQAAWERVAHELESAAARLFPGSLLDRREAAVRGLIRLGAHDEAAVAARLRELHGALAARHPLAIGLSNRCRGAAAYATGFEEAEGALVAGSVLGGDGGVTAFDDLGAYKYLLRVSAVGRVRDRRGEALQRLADYDRRHRSQLLRTLEEYLMRRGNIAAAAAGLYVHPNTLRQRLRRITELTGLDVAGEDWLMIEIELKLLRLEEALGDGRRA